MKTLVVFGKAIREMSREAWMLGLTLAFAPLFVFLYWIWFSGGSTTYGVVLINQDRGITLPDGSVFNAGTEAEAAIVGCVTYADGKPILKAIPASSVAEARNYLENRRAAAFLVIPEDFTRTLETARNGGARVKSVVTFGGDVANPYYMVAVNLAIAGMESYINRAAEQEPFIEFTEEALGLSGVRTEFENYVPGALIFSIIMLIFLASMTAAREIETGTLRRLQMTRMSSGNLLGGITLAIALVGAISITVAFGTAVLLGFRSLGPLWVAILVGSIASLSVIGMGMVVASFTRTVSQAFVVANFPLAFMMFFSGVIFPMPPLPLFTLGGHDFGLYDILPPSRAVMALNKVLTMGAGFLDVLYELAMLTVLSLLYFATGALLFRRFHLRPE